jgi:actin-related protein
MITSEGSAGPIVIDVGSSTIRAGFAGEARPALVEHCTVGRRGKDVIFPVSYETPINDLEIVPIWKPQDNSSKHPEIMSEESLFHILDSVTRDSRITPQSENVEELNSSNPVLISESSVQNIAYRQKVIQLLFEKLGARAAFVCKRSVLSAFSVGKTNAVVVSVGAAVSSVSCVVGGHASQHFYSTWNMAGNALDHEIMVKLRNQNPSINFLPRSFSSPSKCTKSFHDFAEQFHVSRMKESICRVSENRDIRVNVNSAAYELPDGTLVDCNKVAQSVPELLFSGNTKSIGSMVHEVIEKQRSSDESLAQTLLSSVVVCGGTSAMTGFTERVENDLSKQYQGSAHVKCFYGQSGFDRRHSAWIGGSIVASLGAFSGLWITKREYEENGIGIVGKKCP